MGVSCVAGFVFPGEVDKQQGCVLSGFGGFEEDRRGGVASLMTKQPGPVVTCQSPGFQQQPQTLEPPCRAGLVSLRLQVKLNKKKRKKKKRGEATASSSRCTHCCPLSLRGLLINHTAPLACSAPGARVGPS